MINVNNCWGPMLDLIALIKNWLGLKYRGRISIKISTIRLYIDCITGILVLCFEILGSYYLSDTVGFDIIMTFLSQVLLT